MEEETEDFQQPRLERGSFGNAQSGVGQNDETTSPTPRKQSATPHPTLSTEPRGLPRALPRGELSAMDKPPVSWRHWKHSAMRGQ